MRAKKGVKRESGVRRNGQDAPPKSATSAVLGRNGAAANLGACPLGLPHGKTFLSTELGWHDEHIRALEAELAAFRGWFANPQEAEETIRRAEKVEKERGEAVRALHHHTDCNESKAGRYDRRVLETEARDKEE